MCVCVGEGGGAPVFSENTVTNFVSLQVRTNG